MKKPRKATKKKIPKRKKRTSRTPKRKKASTRRAAPRPAAPKVARSIVPPNVKLAKSAGIATLEFLEKSWPVLTTPTVAAAFEELKSTLKGKVGDKKPSVPARPAVKEETTRPIREDASRPFDTLDIIRRVPSSHDLLFLSRQETYHIAACTETPRVWADEDQVGVAISRMMEHIVRRAAPGSQIAMELKGVALQSGPGVELT